MTHLQVLCQRCNLWCCLTYFASLNIYISGGQLIINQTFLNSLQSSPEWMCGSIQTGYEPVEHLLLGPRQGNGNYLNKQKINLNSSLRIGFKLGVSFSPLHADGNHPVENKEACTWYSVKKEESKDCKKHIHFFPLGVPWRESHWHISPFPCTSATFIEQIQTKFTIIKFFTISVSVRLSDRSDTGESKKKLSKIAPSWDWTQDLWIITLMLYWLC